MCHAPRPTRALAAAQLSLVSQRKAAASPAGAWQGVPLPALGAFPIVPASHSIATLPLTLPRPTAQLRRSEPALAPPYPAAQPRRDLPRPIAHVLPDAVIQRLGIIHRPRKFKVSKSKLYAVAIGARMKRSVLWVKRGRRPPNIGMGWTPAGTTQIDGIDYQGHTPDREAVQDCIKTAQRIMLGISASKDLDPIPEPHLLHQDMVDDYRSVSKPNYNAVKPGGAYLVAHSAAPGDFHAAAVIDRDGKDRMTLETDASNGAKLKFGKNFWIFDMYEEGSSEHSFGAQTKVGADDKFFNIPPKSGRGMLGDVMSGIPANKVKEFGK